METATRRRLDNAFDIHVDAVATEETEMMVDDDNIEDVDPAGMEDTEHDDDDEEEEEEEDNDSSDDDQVERSVQEDMDKLQRDFPGFRDKYRLIKRIGEGMLRLILFLEPSIDCYSSA